MTPAIFQSNSLGNRFHFAINAVRCGRYGGKNGDMKFARSGRNRRCDFIGFRFTIADFSDNILIAGIALMAARGLMTGRRILRHGKRAAAQSACPCFPQKNQNNHPLHMLHHNPEKIRHINYRYESGSCQVSQLFQIFILSHLEGDKAEHFGQTNRHRLAGLDLRNMGSPHRKKFSANPFVLFIPPDHLKVFNLPFI